VGLLKSEEEKSAPAKILKKINQKRKDVFIQEKRESKSLRRELFGAGVAKERHKEGEPQREEASNENELP